MMGLIGQQQIESNPPPLANIDVSEETVPKPLLTLAVVNCALFTTIDLMRVFVVPVFAAIFADLYAKLPALTLLLIDWTDFVRNQSWGGDPVLGSFALVIAICLLKGVTPRLCLKVAAWTQVFVLFVMLASLFLPIFQADALSGNMLN
jgi:hypothetical protein